MSESHAMNHHLYCVCVQVSENSKAVSFKIVHADGLDTLRNSAKTAHSSAPRTVFVLGPFLDNDEAKNVHSQALSLLTRYRVRGDWLEINPLDIGEFWTWVDAQILPIHVHEKLTRFRRSHTSIREVRRTMAIAKQRVAVEQGMPKSPRSQS